MSASFRDEEIGPINIILQVYFWNIDVLDFFHQMIFHLLQSITLLLCFRADAVLPQAIAATGFQPGTEAEILCRYQRRRPLYFHRG